MEQEVVKKTATATFGAGCFWGPEAKFQNIKGVIATSVGYIGGTLENPTYQDVCSGRTGHAEAVEIVYDPTIISYEELLKAFWKIHNPTHKNRQGVDIGTQYRSAIFFHNDEQRTVAEASKESLEKSGPFKQNIATEISPASTFYRAEEYHQKFYQKHKKPRQIRSLMVLLIVLGIFVYFANNM